MEKLGKSLTIILATLAGIIGLLGYFRVVPNIDHDIKIAPLTYIFLLLFSAAYPIFLLFRNIQEISKTQAKEVIRVTGKLMILIHAGREVFEYLTKKDKADGLNHIERIIQNRKSAITSAVESELDSARLKIVELIDSQMIDAFTTKAKEHLSLKAMKDVIDLAGIESKLKTELSGAQNEINQLILGKLFAGNRYEYFLRVQISIEEALQRLADDQNSLIRKFSRKLLLIYNPKLKDLFQPEYYKRTMLQTFGVENLTDLVRVSLNTDEHIGDAPYKLDGFDVFSVASLFDVGGINEIITDTIIDIIGDEIQNQAIIELLSWAGDIFLPGLSFLRLAYKSYKFMNRMSEQMAIVDCRELKERVLHEVSSKVHDIVNESTDNIKKHFNGFASKTLKRIYKMRDKQNDIIRSLRKYGKALGKEKCYYFPEDDPTFRMYYHYY